LADLVSALLNNGTAVYEMGPVSTAMEHALARFLTKAVGFPETADAVFTSGGSAGNLTALAAARQAKAGFDAWAHGVSDGRAPSTRWAPSPTSARRTTSGSTSTAPTARAPRSRRRTRRASRVCRAPTRSCGTRTR